MSPIARPFAVTVLLLTLAAPGGAQVSDHLKCYKVKDALALKGTVDLDTPQFGLDPGCKISRAKLFCVPATKTNIAVTNKKTEQPITPLPIGGGASGARPDDRICYKVKCPEPFPPDTQATDQFGTRTFTKFKTQLLCTPAFKGSARFVDNGNSITDNYTGLQWVKTNNQDGVADFGNPQDADNTYTWGNLGGCTFTGCANGSAFTDYLSRLNFCSSQDGSTPVFAGFAGHCDWRLPTIQELKTIIDLGAAGCSSGGPCIDPILGPTVAFDYWSGTTHAGGAAVAWVVDFSYGGVVLGSKDVDRWVRAVRAGS
jgi:hypothetical protein